MKLNMISRETVLVVFLLLGFCYGDTFTSIREMESLFDLEQNLVKGLDSFLKHANFELEVMERHYNELSKIEKEITDIDKYVENPVNAYSAIRRMHYDWPVTFKLMSNSPFFEENPEFPDKSVLEEAIANLVQWQIENKLDAKTLARGLYEGTKPHANMTAEDCLEIAMYCFNNKQKKLSIQWLEEALAKVDESFGGSAHLLTKVLEYTFLAKCLTGDQKGSVSTYQSLITDGALWYSPSAELKKVYSNDKVKKCVAAAKKDSKAKKNKKIGDLYKRFDWSSELCLSAQRPTAKEAKCYLIFYYKKFYVWKAEEISTEPRITVFYDFLPHDFILDIKESAMNEFESLRPEGVNGPVGISDKWIIEKFEKYLDLGFYIKLKDYKTDFRVFVHGPGGQLTSFNSSKTKVSGSDGHFYYFLNDVPRGGNVVFPSAKVSVEPTKGSLLFWFHPEDNIEVKECPVLVGSKWVLHHFLEGKD